jgi:hypothetical protein
MVSEARLTPEAFRLRLALIAVLGLIALGALLFVRPIPQDPAYHNFADQRTLLGIPHALNVLSNLPYLIFGVLGIAWLLSPAARRYGASFLYAWEWWAFLILFTFVAVTGVGSSYYHWNPNNGTLYWDRLPLTVVFMTFFVLVFAERVAPRAGFRLLVPALVLGIFGVTYWYWTEMRGRGDMRIYALVQFFPLFVLPIILLAFPPRYTGKAAIWGVLALYALAKLMELLDRPICAAGGFVSGHTLKHLLSSLGALWILQMLQHRRPLPDGTNAPNQAKTESKLSGWMSRKSLTRVFISLNLAIILYLLTALWVDRAGITRGYFTDYFCGIIPAWLVPINLLLFFVGLSGLKILRFCVLLPLIALALALCFRDSLLFWLFGRWVPGK